MKEKIKAVALCGQTASGKSALAMTLCGRFPFEIAAMDSMQIYRGMDIGTAKPTRVERALVPHHLLDIVSPKESFAVADYVDAAGNVIREIASRGKIPLFVGGTGLYLQAMMHGLSLGGSGENKALREELNRVAARDGGKAELHARLARIDPVSAEKLHENDLRRVIRAIEIFEETGVPASLQRAAETDNALCDILPVAIRVERSCLYEKLEKRVDEMLAAGLQREVEMLLQSGVTPEMQSMQGIGYKEIIPVVRGEIPLADARREMILSTRHYAKRQETWFKREPAVCWLEAGNGLAGEAETLIARWLSEGENDEGTV